MDNLDSFSIEEQLLLIIEKSIGWPGGGGSGRYFASRRAHAVEDIFVRNDGRAFRCRRAQVARDIASRDGVAGLAEDFISTHMIGMEMGVDDVVKVAARQLLDLR